MNIKNMNLLEKIRERRFFKERRKAQMDAIGQELKQSFQNSNTIQYQKIGDYEKGIINPMPEFRERIMLSNFAIPGQIVSFSDNFVPARIKILKIKQSRGELTPQETQELYFWQRNQNKRELENEREINRNIRFYSREAFNIARKWF
ncbi:hypothetical protein [Aulosira sp. FACHB-615]|uniref:hypothetical protein n=1 Tax=Aulosira sp. FACHB-615 TaxID=2692777 RepID=UPI0016831FBC|nr:hypothetical protein [Aulosira sp. FACHB-615]MBD2490390.1 hypothetical protein [Aulosira sp. FACHB-615]